MSLREHPFPFDAGEHRGVEPLGQSSNRLAGTGGDRTTPGIDDRPPCPGDPLDRLCQLLCLWKGWRARNRLIREWGIKLRVQDIHRNLEAIRSRPLMCHPGEDRLEALRNVGGCRYVIARLCHIRNQTMLVLDLMKVAPSTLQMRVFDLADGK